MLVGKDQEEEAGVFWALLKGRWRPSVEEDAAGMSARTERICSYLFNSAAELPL